MRNKNAWLTGDYAAAGDTICRRLRIPNDLGFMIAVSGALWALTSEDNWEEFGSMTAEETAMQAKQMLWDWWKDCPSMIGTVVATMTGSTPDNMLLCDGSSYSKQDYPELWEVTASTFKDFFNETFTVPDLRGSFVKGRATGDAMGAEGGQSEVALTKQQLPVVTVAQNAHGHQAIAHTHTQVGHQHLYQTPSINIDVEAPGAPDPFGAGFPMVPAGTDWRAPEILPAAGAVNVTTATNQPFGGGQSHDNMPPFVALRYCVIAKD